uniref:Transmembrane protein n=1 Tax=Lotharella oceanica TaxID=641309 RepID=A0A7S2X6E7_9EUKA
MSEGCRCCALVGNLRDDFKHIPHLSTFDQVLLASTVVVSWGCTIAAHALYCCAPVSAYFENNFITVDLVAVFMLQMILLVHDVSRYDFDWLWLLLFPGLTFGFFWGFSWGTYMAIRIVRIDRLSKSEPEGVGYVTST